MGKNLAATSITQETHNTEEGKDDSDHNESDLAENLIQMTFVAKKADRLIKEFQTESDNEQEIAEANSAVK